MKFLSSSLIVVGGVAFFFYWLSTPPEKIAFDGQCRPDGFPAKLSEVVHGSGFWNTQLDALRKKRADLEDRPRRYAETQVRVEPFLRELDTRTAQFWAEHPQVAPTPAQQVADALRKQADEIEQAEMLKLWMLSLSESIAHLSKCETVIQSLLRQP